VTLQPIDLDRPAATPAPAHHPEQPLLHLDALWIQVTGTLCNLSCAHCFVTAGPADDRIPLMSRAEVRARADEALALGVKELYLTGGEPFLHPELEAILADLLALAPCTVLTNGTLFTSRRLEELARLERSSRWSLEIRVSLDGHRAAEHDAIRGPGTFERALDGLRQLERHGMLPIVTITQTSDEDPLVFRRRCLDMLRAAGLSRPRIKLLPLFRIGRERARTRGYEAIESLADLPPHAFDPTRLQCGSCRAVTRHGVYVCPLLVDEPGGRMGDTLADAARPFPLAHGACYTCYVTGMTCANG
jgi:sulfatase maturation enzyme AslB (radical SAM superfamily)